MTRVMKKMREVNYFFLQMEKSTWNQELYEFYFSAFLNASRNVTFVMQSESKHVTGFNEWYSELQRDMNNDIMMQLFRELRNYSIKQGENKIIN